MNASSFFLAAALLLPVFNSSAQTLVAVPDEQELVGVYPASAGRPAASAGSITYFGTINSQDVSHSQFTQLRQVFAATQPTLVVVEKPDLGTDGTEAATIASKGAPGYARLLAQQHQVPTERLDNPDAEYAYLRTKLDAEQLKLYYLLREARRFQQSTGASKDLMVKAMKAYIANSSYFLPGTEHTIQSVAELATAFHKHCPDGGEWWNAPTAYFCPQAATMYSEGSFAKMVNNAISEYRERYVYGPLAARAQAGERILVVTSCDQLPAPATASPLAVK